ncbi:GNAT family N-acetyltransferase [Dyadobacter diqingensis]|uniref:GNAT family N-acetyltransferase n=1 Tax=Dyadobacter diqingensis TaxID=2938121 RepID=UPI0020C256C0|nr:GNAT family N-acetyltransferase [Dyadobacter diqingensis]
MKIRKFQISDIEEIVTLFYQTVHSVNTKDYTQQQVDAWASENDRTSRLKSWKQSMNSNDCYVAWIGDKVVGFSDVTPTGYLDRLFVHKDFQGQGIASALLDHIENEARKSGLTEIYTHSSITAKPFFENRGYQLIQAQEVARNDVELINFRMLKRL